MKKALLILFALFLFIPLIVSAQAPANVPPVGSANTPCSGDLCLKNPLGAINTPAELIGRILNSVFGIVGSLALVMFVYGGLTWMTSSGNPEKVKKGRDILIWSAIGLFVVFSSYALVRVVLTTIVA